MGFETLILDGQHRIPEVGRKALDLHQFALLPQRSVVRAEFLGFQQDRAEFLSARQRADLRDRRTPQAQHDVARGLGAARVLERAQMDAHALVAPHVLSRR